MRRKSMGTKFTLAFEAHRELLRPMMTYDIETKVFAPLYDCHVDLARQGLEELVGEWLGYMPELVPVGFREDHIRRMAGNHGVMGTINLLRHISAKSLDSEWRRSFQAIAAAILVHHLPEKPEISFDKQPLSFILAFVDEIQEWSRLHIYRGEHKLCLEKIEIGPFLSRPEQPRVLRFKERLVENNRQYNNEILSYCFI